MQSKTVFLPVAILLFFIFAGVASADTQLNIGKHMVAGGIGEYIMNMSDSMVAESKLSMGDVNATGEYQGQTIEPDEVNFRAAQVPVFGVALHPIDILENEAVKTSVSWSVPAFQYCSVFFLLVLYFFVILQKKHPKAAFDMAHRYYTPSELIKYSVSAGFWYLFCPATLAVGVWLTNYLLGGMDTSILNQIEISSDNLPQYFTLGVCSQTIKFYFAIRNVILIYAAIMWYFLGLVVAVKKTRWFGLLFMGYVYLQMLIQVLIVSLLVAVVKFVEFGGFYWMEDVLLYGGLAIVEALICAAAFTLPIWLPRVMPRQTYKIYWLARSMEAY